MIGGFARVIQGTDELTHGLDLTPSLRAENLRRLGLALVELDAERVDGQTLALDEATIRDHPLIAFRSPYGELQLVPEPAGTREGYDDLRRAATREPTRQGSPPPRRLDRRPRPHARRPRPRAGPAVRSNSSDTSANSNADSATDSTAEPPERRLQPSAYRNYQRR